MCTRNLVGLSDDEINVDRLVDPVNSEARLVFSALSAFLGSLRLSDFAPRYLTHSPQRAAEVRKEDNKR
jgi:hypothetical protein